MSTRCGQAHLLHWTWHYAELYEVFKQYLLFYYIQILLNPFEISMISACSQGSTGFSFQCWQLKIVCCGFELSFTKQHLISYYHVKAFTIPKHILNFFWYVAALESVLQAADILAMYGSGTLATPNCAVKYYDMLQC